MKITAIILSIINPIFCIETAKLNLYRTIVKPSLCIDIIKPKLCMNCTHFIQNHRDIKYSKCSLFPNLQDDTIFIDNIQHDIHVEYYHCSIARNYNHMCGKKGKKYEEH